MEIKKKVKETKENVKNWVDDHKEKIKLGAALLGTAILTGAIGHKVGYDAGRSDEHLDFIHLFTTEDEVKLIRTRNTRTGLVEAFMTEEYDKLLEQNLNKISSDDGSFDFASEVEQ